MLKKALLIATLLIFASAPFAMACGPFCQSTLSTEGFANQQTSAFMDKATVKRGNITNGAQAVAEQKTTASYKAPYGGIGVAAGLGISPVTVKNTKHEASASGLTANIGTAGVLGFRSCAKLAGSGKLQTVAVKGGAAAATTGGFKYSGQISNGLVLGAGLTAGFSNAKVSGNTTTATAGALTASGVTSIGGRGPGLQ